MQILNQFMKKNVPEVKSGDTVRVSIKVKEGAKERVQAYEGLVIAVKHGKGLNGTFTVRKESYGIGVERIFPLHSPRVIKIERIKQSRVRRAKLYFMRDLTGKNARLKELNRDYKMWEEKDAEEELAKLEAEKAIEAEKHAAEKAKEDTEMEKKAASALAARGGKPENVEEVVQGSKEDEKAPEDIEAK